MRRPNGTAKVAGAATSVGPENRHPPKFSKPPSTGPSARSNAYAPPWGRAAPSALNAPWNRTGPATSNVMRTAGPSQKPTTNPDNLANSFQQMQLETPKVNEQVFNPSMGPGPSDVTTNWRFRGGDRPSAIPSSLHSNVGFVVAKISKLSRKDFAKGDIISLPHHTANSNPHVNPATDPAWTLTAVGPSYNKRRMFAVIYIFEEEMLCLPLYTWSGRGISSRLGHRQKDFVAVKNVEDNSDFYEGPHTPVTVKCRKKPLHAATTIALAEGTTVRCNGDIAHVGRMEEKIYFRLEMLYQNQLKEAKKEPYKVFGEKKGF